MSLPGRSPAWPGGLAPEDPDDAAWIAQMMVLDAAAQAARLRRQAWHSAATVREAAERDATTVWRQASVQAAAIREASEREAAQLRATVLTLSAAPDRAVAEPVARPGERQAGRPQVPPRQLVAFRVAAAAAAALFLFALVAGTTEVALHGFAFFVFRSAGTGETGRVGGLQEDQGPGQPDAPRPAPSHARARPSSPVAVRPADSRIRSRDG